MRKIQKARYTRRLAFLTTIAWVLGPLMVPAGQAFAQVTPPPSLAVVQVVNQSGSSVQNLGARAAVALNERFAASRQFTVIGQAEVDAALEAENVVLPLRAAARDETLGRLAQRLHADYLVLAAIDSVQTDEVQKLGVVKSTVQVYGATARGDLAEVKVTAFNLDQATDEMLLVDDALEQNAMGVTKEVIRHLGTRSKIIVRPTEEAVWIGLGEQDYLRVGDELVVLRDGLRIATVKIYTTHNQDCECKIISREQPQIQVRTNDEVQLYRKGSGRSGMDNPDRDPLKEVPSAPDRGHNNSGKILGIVAGVVAIAVGVWAITQGNRRRDDSRTPSLVSPPDNSTFEVDSSDRLVGQVNFAVTTTYSTDSVTIQFASDPGFSNLQHSFSAAGNQSTTARQTTTEDTGEPPFTFIYTPPTDTAFLSPGLYYWRVIAISGNDAHTSNVFRFTITRQGSSSGGDILASPTGVRALPSSGSVEIQWLPVDGATGYRIWRRVLTPRALEVAAGSRAFRPGTGSSAWLRGSGVRSARVDRRNRRPSLGSGSRQTADLAGFSEIAQVSDTATSYVDATVQNGVEYSWVVLSVSSAGTVTPLTSASDGSFASTTPLSASAPATPTNFTATPGDGQVTLSWTANTETDLAGYQVFRSTAANGNFDDVTNNLVTDTGSPAAQALSAGAGDVTVVDGNVTNGVAVFYRIRAVQLTSIINGQTAGGRESPLSDAVQAVPSTAPAQELQVIQPPNNSEVDTDRPLLAWRGVTGASQYTVQISTSTSFPEGSLITTTQTGTEVIYPLELPSLQAGTTYFMRVGVYDEAQQALRFGTTSSFQRVETVGVTTRVQTTLTGAAHNGAKIIIDGADSGKLSPADFILRPKADGSAYTIEAIFNDIDGKRYSATTTYTPDPDNSTVTLALAVEGIAPATPTGLIATGMTDRIQLRWNPDPNLGTAGAVVAGTYSIQRRSNTAEGPYAEIAVVTAPSSASQSQVDRLLYTDFNVHNGVRYYYRIVARSAAGVASIESVTANAVSGVGAIQTITPQDNQTFTSTIVGTGESWTNTIDFGWVAVASAVRYVFEIGVDAELNVLLEGGNEIIAASAQPATSVTLGGTTATPNFFTHSGSTPVALYWRVSAVDDNNLVINQTEARRIFYEQPRLVVVPVVR